MAEYFVPTGTCDNCGVMPTKVMYRRKSFLKDITMFLCDECSKVYGYKEVRKKMARFNNPVKDELEVKKPVEVAVEEKRENVIPIGRLTDTQYMIMLLEEINRKLDSVITD